MYTKEQVAEHVNEALDAMFSQLVERWELTSGDQDPIATLRWEDETVPAIIDFCWHLYEGNQRYTERVTVVLELLPDRSEGLDVLLADRLSDVLHSVESVELSPKP